MQVQSLGWEDPLEKGMASHSSVLAWRIWWTEEPGRLQSVGSQKSQKGLSDETNSNNSNERYKSLWIKVLIMRSYFYSNS